MKKTYVLDTNVLLHSALSMESFADNDVVIPMAVIEELDKFKKNQDELGRNARQVIRRLDALRVRGNLREGVSLKNGHSMATGNLLVLTAASFDGMKLDDDLKNVFSSDLGSDSPDNRILRVAYALQKKGQYVVFISKDINLRLKADALGLKVEDYERGKVDFESLYTGFQEIPTDRVSIDRLYREREVPYHKDMGLEINEFAVFQVENAKQSAIARLQGDGKLHLLEHGGERVVWNISGRNKEQRMALDLLCDPEVKLVTLVGGAGTGKTLLALAAALQSTLRDNLYERILVSRPIIPLGNDIGYLPGDKGAKLASWMQPIFDNLEFLLQGEERNGKQSHGSSRMTPESLINSHRIELEALTYIRGRSIPRQFVIVDEAQNLTPHEIKTIVSRAGEDTKIVLTGDPQQIDNPYLDASSNGLTCAAQRMRGHAIHGHITLAKSERSELAALAAKLL